MFHVGTIAWVESDEVLQAYALSDDGLLQQLERLGVQRAMVDTGAATSLGPPSDETLLTGTSPSQIQLKVAVGSNPIPGRQQGNLPMFVLGASNTCTVLGETKGRAAHAMECRPPGRP